MKNTNTKVTRALQLQEAGKIAEAAQLFREVLQRNPKDGVALFSLALLTLQHFKDFNTALGLAEAGIAAIPNYAPIHALHADALQACGQFEAAIASYERAISIDPKLVVALTNCSVLLQHLSRHHEALIKLQQVLSIEPDNALALSNCGTLLTEFKQSKEAIALFERLLEVAPNFDYALGMLCFEKLHICDWSDLDTIKEKIVTGLSNGLRTCKSFPMMAISDDPVVLHQSAKLFTEQKFPATVQPLWTGETYRHQKIRIAYISADLREHPVGHLMAGVIERHDRERFETIAISLGIDDGSSLRARFIAAFDQFYDAQKMSSLQIAQLIRNQEIDIAINLSGYTSGSRSEIFAYRPAPIQVNYLGYPGTLGADYIDYILADRHVAPFSDQEAYSEKIVHLPHSYLPTDGQLVVADRTPTRTECGLPEKGFVFCSFNHDYKISPQIFAIWMRLLQAVPDSVLWLMKLNEPAKHNLCSAAQNHGIDPARLIFATRVPKVEDHLARYRQADLFLDCYPYNAHTTAADALFVGLPVITYMGHAFQGRVAGSLLSTLEMPELITRSLAEYEALALRLATNPKALAETKEKLSKKVANTPLYDTNRFCKNVEIAYTKMWERWLDGQKPEKFAVEESPHSSNRAQMLTDKNKRPTTQAISHWAVNTKNGMKICVQPHIDQMSTYILLEQEDWFEDEIAFVRSYITPEMNAIDIGANHGVYALSIAKILSSGHVWAFEPTLSPGNMFAKSIALNGFENRVTWVHAGLSNREEEAQISISSNSELNTLHPTGNGSLETIKLEKLDDYLTRNQIQDEIHFVKLDAEGEEINVIQGGRHFFAEHSPLIMFELKHGRETNYGLIESLRALKYEIYRLLPDLNCLVEFQNVDSPDTLNLFACKADRIKQLRERQLLATPGAAISNIGVAEKSALAELASLPYAQLCQSDWDEHSAEIPIDYLDALASTLMIHHTSRPVDQRFALLNRATAIVDGLLSQGTGAHYSIWLLKVHLMHLWNQRSGCVNLCQQVLKSFSQSSIPAWPFIPPKDTFFTRSVNGSPEQWLQAILTEFIETRQSYSSYFVADPLTALVPQLGNGNHDIEIERRFVLAAKRSGRGITIPPGFPLLNPDRSPNSAIWHQILGTGFPATLLNGLSPIHIVDVGASTHGKLTEPYAPLMEMRAAKVTGFEPNKEECKRLNDLYASTGQYHYFPDFVGKGGPATFYETNWYMTGSLYKPNEPVLNVFEQLDSVVRLKQEHAVNTVSLRDLANLDDIDMIKIDVQGAELDVFQGAGTRLDEVLVIWTEVEFIPLYEDQPLFSDVDRFLRQKGFIFHAFEPIAARCYKPYSGLTKNRKGTRQAIWSDAIYVRDPALLARLSTPKLRKFAAILDSVTKSYDLCFLVLQHVDRREGTDFAALYLTYQKSNGLM